MTCIKCGRQIAEGELFCEACKNGPAAKHSHNNKEHNRASGASNPPKKGGARLAPKPEHGSKKNAGTVRTLAVLLVIVGLVAAAAVGWIITSRHDLAKEKNALRAHEADVQVREADAAAALQEAEHLREQLESANTRNAALTAQVEELQQTIDGNENKLYQSEYDLTTRQEQLDALTDENAQMATEIQRLESENNDFSSQISALQAEIASKQSAMDALQAQSDGYKEKADFMDAHVVFVENDGTNHYHTYACSSFKKKSYWCYSRKLAESLGYTACPLCGG